MFLLSKIDILCVICCSYGLLSGGDVTLTSVVVTDLFSVDKLPNAIGILSLFEGIASAIPFVGKFFL